MLLFAGLAGLMCWMYKDLKKEKVKNKRSMNWIKRRRKEAERIRRALTQNYLMDDANDLLRKYGSQLRSRSNEVHTSEEGRGYIDMEKDDLEVVPEEIAERKKLRYTQSRPPRNHQSRLKKRAKKDVSNKIKQGSELSLNLGEHSEELEDNEERKEFSKGHKHHSKRKRITLSEEPRRKKDLLLENRNRTNFLTMTSEKALLSVPNDKPNIIVIDKVKDDFKERVLVALRKPIVGRKEELVDYEISSEGECQSKGYKNMKPKRLRRVNSAPLFEKMKDCKKKIRELLNKGSKDLEAKKNVRPIGEFKRKLHARARKGDNKETLPHSKQDFHELSRKEEGKAKNPTNAKLRNIIEMKSRLKPRGKLELKGVTELKKSKLKGHKPNTERSIYKIRGRDIFKFVPSLNKSGRRLRRLDNDVEYEVQSEGEWYNNFDIELALIREAYSEGDVDSDQYEVDEVKSEEDYELKKIIEIMDGSSRRANSDDTQRLASGSLLGDDLDLKDRLFGKSRRKFQPARKQRAGRTLGTKGNKSYTLFAVNSRISSIGTKDNKESEIDTIRKNIEYENTESNYIPRKEEDQINDKVIEDNQKATPEEDKTNENKAESSAYILLGKPPLSLSKVERPSLGEDIKKVRQSFGEELRQSQDNGEELNKGEQRSGITKKRDTTSELLDNRSNKKLTRKGSLQVKTKKEQPLIRKNTLGQESLIDIEDNDLMIDEDFNVEDSVEYDEENQPKESKEDLKLSRAFSSALSDFREQMKLSRRPLRSKKKPPQLLDVSSLTHKSLISSAVEDAAQAFIKKVIASNQEEELKEHKIIDKDGKATWKKTHFIFMIDCSGSMKGSRWEAVKLGFTTCLQKLKHMKEIQVSAFTFDDKPTLFCREKTPKDVIPKIKNLPFTGNGTNYKRAMDFTISLIAKAQKYSYLSCVLFLSDGLGGYPQDSVNELLVLKGKGRKIAFCTIACETDEDNDMMLLANGLRGEHYKLINLEASKVIFSTILQI